MGEVILRSRSILLLAPLTFIRDGAKSTCMAMAKSDPTKSPEFKRVLGNLLSAPPKPHSEMKHGEVTVKKAKSPADRGERAKPKSALWRNWNPATGTRSSEDGDESDRNLFLYM